MVEADIGFSNGVDTFSLTAGDYWTHEAVIAYVGAWRDARYNNTAVDDAEQMRPMSSSVYTTITGG